MIINGIVRVLLAFILFSSVNSQFNESLTEWIEAENVTALGRIFANIAPLGEYASDGDPGAVVAAPSTYNPNYYYQITPPLSQLIVLMCTGFATLR
jgi:hypothetical protein